MQLKVLIVDDEAHIRLLLSRTLEEFIEDGVELLIAENGEEALEIITTESPQLVFLDAMMPKINGYDVCKRVKQGLGLTDIYIVMLTAKGQEIDRERGEAVGANLYLTKPFDPDEIYDLTEQVLGL